MADEKKTYLINIESNLKKYIDELIEVKKREEDAKKAVEDLKTGHFKSREEIEKVNAAYRQAKKDVSDATRMVDLASKAINSETGSRKQLEQILKLQMYDMGQLRDAYVKNAQGMDVLNPKYIEQRNAIEQTKAKIIEYDQAINDGRSNIGRYGESVSAAFANAGKSILNMISPMALVAAAFAGAKKIFEGLKEAFMSTTFVMDTMNNIGAVTKQLFYDIAINGKMSMDSLAGAVKIQQQLNELRVQEGFDLYKISIINREEQNTREQAINKTRTHAERLVDLNKVRDLEHQKTLLIVGSIQKEINAKKDLYKQQPENEKLLRNILDLKTKINDAYAQEDQSMKWIDMQRTGFMQEEIDDQKKSLEKWEEAIDETNKKYDDKIEKEKEAANKSLDVQRKLRQDIQLLEIKDDNERALQKLAFDRDDQLRATKNKDELLLIWSKYYVELGILIANQKKKEEDAAWEEGMRISKILFDKNKKAAEETWNKLQESHTKELESEEEKGEVKLQIADAVNKGIQKGSDALFDSKKRRLDEEMNAILSNSNLTESQKTAIQIKYAKEQQKIDIGQAMINGALAIGNALATTKPFIPAALIAAALAAVETGIQIAAIKSQTFTGGSAIAPTAITSSPVSTHSVATSTGSTILTQPQLSQSQLNAIPNENILTVADIAALFAGMPSPIVTVEDINAKIASVRKVSVRANI